MCGICGWISMTLKPQNLIDMMDSIHHRGPDDCGTFIDGVTALGHRRLSIIDINKGSQPMESIRGNAIVFNGEIYNYIELRSELIDKGHQFKTDSDTEVILIAYEEWGYKCLDKLNGMFGFAIYDRLNKQIFLGRDRLGKKPLYYFHEKKLFAFASEIKSLLTLPQIHQSISINHNAISDYLSLGYILTPKTIFKDIKRLEASHYAIYEISTGIFKIRQYWHLKNFFLAEKQGLSKDNQIKGFMDIFEDAVKIRLRSDVPLGGFLSGGLDSSSIITLMKKFSNNNVQAFSIGFKVKDFDETKFARAAAENIKVDLITENYEGPSEDMLSKMIWHFDEPFSDNSLIPVFQLNRLTSKYLKVALSGDGADEILAGYPTYLADYYYNNVYSKIPVIIQRLLSKSIKMITSPSYKKVSLDYKINQFLGCIGLSSQRAHYWWRVIFSEQEKMAIMTPELYNECRDYDPYEAFNKYFDEVKGAGFLDSSLYVDIKTWLQDDILVKVDRMSMANSVEVRSPFLDHRLVEFTAKLPQDAKFRLNSQKYLLREAMNGSLSHSTLNRKKAGFNSPTKDIGINSLRKNQLFSSDFCINSKKEDITYKSFNLAVLEKWIDIYDNYKASGKWETIKYV